MSHEDADPDDDDLSLQSMRSLWRSMPDEEPPAGGLAELMAAARVKADEMKAAQAAPAPAVATEAVISSPPARERRDEPERVSWWQRLVALLQRPPVLALATVTILVGGVVILGQRKEQLDATPQVAQEAPSAETEKWAQDPVSPVVGGAAPAEAAGSAMAPGPVVPEPASDEGAPVAEQAAPGRPADGVGGVMTSGDVVRRPAKAQVTTSSKAAPSKAALTKSAKPKAESNALQLDSSEKKQGIARGDAEEAVDAKADRRDELQATPTTSVSSGAAGGGELAVTQLHAQARAAAARGDCGGARVLVQQIARRDAAYHRAKVATDSTLATCLAK